MANKSFVSIVMEKLEFPVEAIHFFRDLEKKIDDKREEFDLLVQNFNEKKTTLEATLENLNMLAKKMDVNEYSLHMYFLLNCSQALYEQYTLVGIDESIYWNTLADLKCKLIECYTVKGVWGTFVAPWYDRFFNMTLFALGRFQYEPLPFIYDRYEKNGYVVKKGDTVYNMHIPSSGPINDELRLDSYKKAYNFYKKELGEKPLVVICNSWLLYPAHYDFLPSQSNIIRFMNDFEIISSTESDQFEDAWRIFGKDYLESPDKLPTETSLKKAYANRLLNHQKTGMGFGVLLFDGEKIIRS